MKALELFVTAYLLNALWQAPVLAFAAWCAAQLAAGAGPRVQHRLWVTALGLEVVLPACSLVSPSFKPLLSLFWAVLNAWLRAHPEVRGHVEISFQPGIARAQAGLLLSPPLLHLVLLLYAAVILWSALRLLLSLFETRRLVRRASPVARSLTVQDRFAVVSSAEISVPFLTGILRPTLLVPQQFFRSLDAEDCAALLAHESAHAARHDFAKNLLHRVLELPIAFHPAVWFTHTRLAETREMVCDAMAAQQLERLEPATLYARSLVRLASALAMQRAALPLHAIAFCDANTLERRVAMLISKPRKWSRVRAVVVLAACGVVLGLASLSAFALRLPVGAQDASANMPRTVSAGVIAGKLLYRGVPVYPVEAKINHDMVDGSVVMDAVIGKDGSIESLRILKSLRADYDASALDAVRQWKYKPYLLHGEPTEVQTEITVTYSHVE